MIGLVKISLHSRSLLIDSIWIGLTSKLLQELFCRDFLTPLEQTDVSYSLKVRYIFRWTTETKVCHSGRSFNSIEICTNDQFCKSSWWSRCSHKCLLARKWVQNQWKSLSILIWFLASFSIHQPSFDNNILNPNEHILDISTNYSYVQKRVWWIFLWIFIGDF